MGLQYAMGFPRSCGVILLTLGLSNEAHAHVAGLSGAGHSIIQLLKRFKQAHKGVQDRLPGHTISEELPRTQTFDFPEIGQAPAASQQVREFDPEFVKPESPSPLQMISELGEVCKDVPALMKEEWTDAQCSASSEQIFDMIKWTAGSLVHLQAGTEMPLPKDFKEKVRAMSSKMCGNARCEELMAKTLHHGIRCEVAALCAAQSEIGSITMGVCKATVGQLLETSLEGYQDFACDVETGTSSYCEEVAMELVIEHPDCWAQINDPFKGCSASCSRVWHGMRAKYPHCSMTLATKVTRMQHLGASLMSRLPGGGAGGVMRSSDEVCADLSFQTFQAPGPVLDTNRQWEMMAKPLTTALHV